MFRLRKFKKIAHRAASILAVNERHEASADQWEAAWHQAWRELGYDHHFGAPVVMAVVRRKPPMDEHESLDLDGLATMAFEAQQEEG